MANDNTLQIDIGVLAHDLFAERAVDLEGDPAREDNSGAGWHWPASALVGAIADWSPELGWDLICRLLELAPSHDDIGEVAVGPFEDFLHEHGADFVDRIAAEAERNSRLREALAGVWGWNTFPRVVPDRLLGYLPEDVREHWLTVIQTGSPT